VDNELRGINKMQARENNTILNGIPFWKAHEENVT